MKGIIVSIFKSAKDILEAAKVPPAPKRPKVVDGFSHLPEVPEKMTGADKVPAAVPWRPELDNPFRGNRCSIRGCREGVQWEIPGYAKLRQDLDRFLQPELSTNDPLVARIEAARQSVRPARQVEETDSLFFCLVHYSDFMDARSAAIFADRKARETPSKSMQAIVWDGASLEFSQDGKWFTVVDGEGFRQPLEIWRLGEVQAYMAGKRWMTRPLSREDIRELRVKSNVESIIGDMAGNIVKNAPHKIMFGM